MFESADRGTIALEDIAEPSIAEQHGDPLLNRRLRQLIATLPEKPRMVMVLRYQEDLTPEEISEVLDMPVTDREESFAAVACDAAREDRSEHGRHSLMEDFEQQLRNALARKDQPRVVRGARCSRRWPRETIRTKHLLALGGWQRRPCLLIAGRILGAARR